MAGLCLKLARLAGRQNITEYQRLIAEPAMSTSYSIGKHFEDLIDTLVESGRYATASDVVREGLRLVEEREERRRAKLEALRAEIQQGFDSGPMEEIGDLHQWFEGIKARGRERLGAQKRDKKV
jgi:antitoxin ParD1/3/4